MRYGLLSDVHANLHALRAAVAELRRLGVDGWLCAGDLVGYGPYPEQCVEAVAELGAATVHGNHELMLLGRLPRDRCGPDGREALRWTDAVLGGDARAFLEELPAQVRAPRLLMTHGALDDPDRYVERPDDADEQLARLAREHPDTELLVVGHTHRPWLRGPGATVPADERRGAVTLAGDGPFLVNPGSVGQSRRREPRPLARAMLLDLDPGRAGCAAVPVAVPYDDGAARAALRRARLAPDGIHQLRGVVPAVVRRARRVTRRVRVHAAAGVPANGDV